MKNKLIRTVLIVALASMVITACGKSDSGSESSVASASEGESSVLSQYGIKITDVSKYVEIPISDSRIGNHTGNQAFDAFIWGDFEYDKSIEKTSMLDGELYNYVDEDSFREGMKYSLVGDKNLSVVPFEISGARRKYGSDIGTSKQKEELKDELIAQYGEERAGYLYNLYLNISSASFKFDKMDDSGYCSSTSVDGFYYIDNGKLHIYTGEEPTFNPEDGDIIECDIVIEGNGVKLSKDGISCSLVCEAFTQKRDLNNDDICFGSHVSDINNVYKNISFIHIYMPTHSKPDEEFSVMVNFIDGGSAVDPKIVKCDGDALQIKWTKETHKVDGKKEEINNAGEFNCHVISNWLYGFMIEDGGKYYCYQSTWDEYAEIKLQGMIEGEDIGNVSEAEATELMGTQAEIKDDIKDKFSDTDINVDVNDVSGKVTMDSSILFAVDSDTLSEEGKKYLDEFFNDYAEVVLSEKYSDRVSSIVVEGHTDTTGSYEYNMDLSERRAQAVVDYCIGLNSGVKDRIKAKGCSYDNPVYAEDGSVDMDASRRVEFKFVLRKK